MRAGRRDAACCVKLLCPLSTQSGQSILCYCKTNNMPIAIQKLSNYRSIYLAIFFACLITIIFLYQFPRLSFLAVIAAHLSLFLFALTESFGTISNRRSKTNKYIARVAVILLGIILIGYVVSFTYSLYLNLFQ